MSNSVEEAILRADNISVYNEGTYQLKDVSLEVKPKQIISIIGPNGGGKTILARVLAGIIKPQAGRVYKAKGLKIGYVPQHFDMDYLMPLSVKFFLSLSPYFNSDTGAEACRDLYLEHLLDKQFSHLSGGEKQRVLLARAILVKPRMMILDEPTQALDMEGSINFYEILSSYAPKHNCAVVLISHDLNFVMSETDLVICLNGHICCRGTPNEIDSDPAYRKLFGVTVTDHLALYNHHHNHSHK